MRDVVAEGNAFANEMFAKIREEEEARGLRENGKLGKVSLVSDVPRIRLIAFDDIKLTTARHDLVKGLIPRVGLIVVWGPPKSGKSFWIYDIAMYVALGWEYRGRRVHQGPVVYCAFEGQTGIQARCAAFDQRFLPADRDPVPFYLQPMTLDLVRDRAELITAIRTQLDDDIPAMIVLDTLNRSLRGSESSDEDMSAYIHACDALREAFNCAIVVVHHCGVSGDRPRGHTSLTGALDVQIAIRRDTSDNVIAEVELAKDGPQGDTITSRLEVVEVGIDEDGSPITSCVIVPSDASAAGKQPKGPRPTGAAAVALELLKKAIDEAGEPAPPSPHIPKNTRTIGVETWRRYCYQGTIAESDSADTRRKAFVRASAKLQSLNLIGIWGNHVWLT